MNTRPETARPPAEQELAHAITRAQIYGFLAHAFLYPAENWTEDLDLFETLCNRAGLEVQVPPETAFDLDSLQAEHRQTFGVTGSLCYESEYGLANEFQMSQEMADILGFYGAFGLRMGGRVRERADHIAAELEFLHVVNLKEAYAWQEHEVEFASICREAQARFLTDHLGRWMSILAQVLQRGMPASLFAWLASVADAWVQLEAARLAVELNPLAVRFLQPTPEGTPFSCAGCALAVPPAGTASPG